MFVKAFRAGELHPNLGYSKSFWPCGNSRATPSKNPLRPYAVTENSLSGKIQIGKDLRGLRLQQLGMRSQKCSFKLSKIFPVFATILAPVMRSSRVCLPSF